MTNIKHLSIMSFVQPALGLALAVILMPIIAFGPSSFWSYIVGPPKACDLTSVSHRNFTHYYGISRIDNPLSHLSAEQDAASISKCYPFYDHMHLFPNGDIPLSKSMVIQALRGSGKSQIRQCVINKLSGEDRILINIYGSDINTYLDNFVVNIDITSEHPYEKISKYWKKEHFFQVILTEIASRFVNEKFISTLKAKQHTISLETRTQVAVLLTFYSTMNSDILCKMVNILLYEITECVLCRRISCSNVQYNSVSAEMMIELSKKHRKVRVKRETPDTVACLRVLTAIYEKTKSSPLSVIERSYRDQVALLLNFLRTLKITAAVIVDSLDESSLFSAEGDSHLHALQAFVNSTTNDDVLHLALGNWGGDVQMPNNLAFYIFIPMIPSTPLKIPWTRTDKIPVIELKWNKLLLINYADYMIDYLRSHSRNQCELLPDICSLLGGRNLCLETMNELRHPRDFNIFFEILTRYMSANCVQRNPPFRATKEDLKHVLVETKEAILNEKLLNSFEKQ